MSGLDGWPWRAIIRQMRAFIAYSLLVIGLPVFVGLAIGSVITIPIIWLLRSKTKINILNFGYLDIVHGFISSLAGALLFRIFGLTAGLAVPIIMAAWQTFYIFRHTQPKRDWLSWIAGLFIGWFTLAKMICPA